MPKKGKGVKIKGAPALNFEDFDADDVESFPAFQNGGKGGAKSPTSRPQFMSLWKGTDGFSNSPITPKKANAESVNAENPMYTSDNEDDGSLSDRRISMLPDPTEGGGSLKRKDPEATNGLYNGTSGPLTSDDPEAPPRKKSITAQAAERLALLKRKMSKGDSSDANENGVTFIKKTSIANDAQMDSEPAGASSSSADAEANATDESSDKGSDQGPASSEPVQTASAESPSDSELSELSQVTPEKLNSSTENSPKGSVVDAAQDSTKASPKPTPPASASSSPKTSPRESTAEPPNESPQRTPRGSLGSLPGGSQQTSPKGSVTTPPKLSPPPSNRGSTVTLPESPRGSVGSLSASSKVSPKTSPRGSLSSSTRGSPQTTPKSSTADPIGADSFGASSAAEGASADDKKDSDDTKPTPPPKPLKSALKKQGPAALAIWQKVEQGEEPVAAASADDQAEPGQEDAGAASTSAADKSLLQPDKPDGGEERKGSYEPILPFFPTNVPAKTEEAKQESAPQESESKDPPDYLSLLETEGPRRLKKANLKKSADFVPPRSTSTAVMPDQSKLLATGTSKLEKHPDDSLDSSSEDEDDEEEEEEDEEDESAAALAKKVSRTSPPMLRKARPSVSFAGALIKDSSDEEDEVVSEESEPDDAEALARKQKMKRKMTPSSKSAPVFINEQGEVEEGGDGEVQALSEEQGEGDEDTDPLLGEDGEKKKKKKKRELDFEYRIKKWDVFLTSPVGEDNSARDECYDTGMKLMKIFYIFLSFFIVLGLTVISKVTLMMAASNSLAPHLRDVTNSTMTPNNDTLWVNPEIVTFERTWYCNKFNERINITSANDSVLYTVWRNFTKCMAVPPHWVIGEQLSDTNINPNEFTCLRAQPISGQGLLAHTSSISAKMYSSHSVRWTWCLWLMIVTPEFFVFFRCLWRLLFKKKNTPPCSVIFRMILLETIQMIGQCILVFRVLPRLDHAAGGAGILTSVAFVPSLLSCFIVDRTEEDYKELETEEGCIHKVFNRFCSEVLKKTFILVMNFICMGLQVIGLLFFPILFNISGINWHRPFQTELQYTIPISLFLISLTWWLNYIGDDFRWGKLARSLDGFRRKVKKTRTKIYIWASLWKMIVAFLCLVASYSYDYGAESLFGGDKSVADIMRKIFEFSDDLTESYDGYTMIGTADVGSMRTDFVYVWLVNSGLGLAVYFLCRTAAKVHIQLIAYALPLMLSTPVAIGSLLGFCEHWAGDPCFFDGAAPAYLFWQCPVKTGETVDIPWYIWVFFAYWLSQYWIAAHIWKPKSERLAQTDKLFLFPLFNGVYLEQFLLYNRNRKDKGVQSSDSADTTSVQRLEDAARLEVTEQNKKNKKNQQTNQLRSRAYSTVQNTWMARKQFVRDNTPKVFICATMWHETEMEMIQMLNSIFKLDMDQNIRRNVQELLGTHDEDYYEFEAHIFFDDAFDYHDENTGNEFVANDYVRKLVSVVDTSASHVHETNIRVQPPTKYPTPYGGRLEWSMPGGNKIVAHLKDKAMIRHKKRWSQVMYMYYFLGFNLWSKTKDIKRKEIKSDNTFLLALDGDVDFEPSALLLLIDMMKKNLKVGAACGRIHPTGSGLMVWYQKFEYALGHWMQKSTEHVLGCVLCSPGCFSLFRGSAVMDENVMKKYTTMPTEAQHFVQYDQGEDRWLCTLLLQQGYKVEYSAASDSFTFAPEDFKEFFNQRRRWGPSTMANIIDLLLSWRQTVRNNENISFLYICYQAALMASSIVGTGSIFLMIVGALDVALNNQLGTIWSFILNLIPVLIFIACCFWTKSNTQLIIAQIFTVGYALIQMLVLVGIIIQMAEEGPCSPTSIFFIYVACTFLFAALIHPQEMFCVVYGFLYYMLIPSMYMLLMIYSLTNLNNVSWGTREVKKTEAELAQEAEKQLQKVEEKDAGMLSWMRSVVNTGDPDNKTWTCSLGDCCRCVCCPKKEFDNAALIVQTQEQLKAMVQEGFHKISSGEEIEAVSIVDPSQPFKPKSILKKANKQPNAKRKKDKMKVKIRPDPVEIVDFDIDSDDDEDISGKQLGPTVVIHRDPLVNPFWAEDKELGPGPTGRLVETELEFFQDLIRRYLKPIEKDAVKEEKDKEALLDLRNKVSFGFFMINAVFVTVIFTLQENVDQVSIRWPCNSLDGRPLTLEPIGFMFLFIFGTILVLQTIGMIVHRAGTFLHLMATTNLSFGAKDTRGGDAVFSELYDLLLGLSRFKADEDDSKSTAGDGNDDDEHDDVRKGRKNTIRNIRKAEKQTMKTWKNTKHPVMSGTMNERIAKRLTKLKDGIEGDTDIKTLAKIVGGDDKARRKSIGFLKSMDKIRNEEMRKPSVAGHRKSVVFLEAPAPDYGDEPEDDYVSADVPDIERGDRRFRAHADRRESVVAFRDSWRASSTTYDDIYNYGESAGETSYRDSTAVDLPEQDYSDSDDDTTKEIAQPGGYQNITHNWVHGEPGFDDLRYGSNEDLINLDDQSPVVFRPTKPTRSALQFDQSGF